MIENLVLKIHEKLKVHRAFVETVLCGMFRADDTGGAIFLLNQGTETSLSFKMRIAEYLDVPTGRELLLLRQASRNFTQASEDRRLLEAASDSDIDR